jgi:hypothetical protein
VLTVLDGNVKSVASGIEVGNDRVVRPVAVLVDDVAAVAVAQQVLVETRIIGPGFRMGPNTDFLI